VLGGKAQFGKHSNLIQKKQLEICVGTDGHNDYTIKTHNHKHKLEIISPSQIRVSQYIKKEFL
jgi:hypothetical protein